MTAMTQRPALEADVLVVGGGLVGGTLACALAQGGLDVIVLDREDPAAFVEDGYDGRSFAVALSSVRLLRGLGLWPGMEGAACPIREIRVSEGSSPLFLHYDHRETGPEPFGHMVEALVFRNALYARLATLDKVRYLAPAGLVHLDRGPARIEATLADGRRVRAPLAVAADGRRSRLRAEAGIRTTAWAYGQDAIVCTVAHERPHGGVAHERFLASGPFAILPLVGNRSSLVWCERPARARAIMGLDDTAFLGELRARFGDFLGTLRVEGRRWSYPLALRFAKTAVAHRLALAGDAAHAMHPIAGQGLNMGLRDVAALAEVLVDARRLGLDIGDADRLERYNRWRRFDNTLMLMMTDGVVRLFAVPSRPVRLARELGLAAVNRVAPLKRLFTRHAMGLVGELPRLMRGLPL